jgi:hypothetical protein
MKSAGLADFGSLADLGHSLIVYVKALLRVNVKPVSSRHSTKEQERPSLGSRMNAKLPVPQQMVEVFSWSAQSTTRARNK